ncbi:MAG TPA: LacI family DNA-binding transcriptional regulator [Roseiflexaceae bacterium]|nr:LacI family DNA-binding transcriptional regulator [Roseiflexaceae bacterium]
MTHRDVAQLAGVSTAVVSYVVNNGPRQTSPEVRERVLKAIAELDYHPNAFARGLRARRTNTIAFIVHDYYAMTVFVAWYTAAMLTGLMEHLKSQGYYILVFPMSVDEDHRQLEQLLRSGRLDGIVLRLVQQPPASDRLLETIVDSQVPCVCIEQPAAPRFGFSSVTYNDQDGAYEATRYLLDQGHRRIAHLCGEHNYGSARARLAGYSKALTDRGLAVDEALISRGSWNHATVAGSIEQFLGLDQPPTAIVAASDELAFAAIEELHRRHHRVPEQIAVVGFDDSALASRVTPPLTTVRIPLHQLGQRAGELILAAVEADHAPAPSNEVLPVTFIRRASA